MFDHGVIVLELNSSNWLMKKIFLFERGGALGMICELSLRVSKMDIELLGKVWGHWVGHIEILCFLSRRAEKIVCELK